jgi:phage tail-like protein
VTGWLVAQLPRVMAADRVVQAFAEAAEGAGDSFRGQLDGLEWQLDADLAPPDMISFLAGWLGFPLDRLDDPALRRPLLRALGHQLARRGTPGALAGLLEQLTGGPVVVTDGGGVFGPGRPVPAPSTVVRAELDRLRAIVERELPIGVRLELVVAPGADR